MFYFLFYFLLKEVKTNSFNYDAWFDYIRLMENDGTIEQVREVYERAIANVPPTQEKRFWRRYIYIWINYALYEELETQVCCKKILHGRWRFFFYSILIPRASCFGLSIDND